MAMRGKVIGAAIGAIVAVLIDASRQSRTRAAAAGAGSTRSTAPADSRTDYDVLGVRHDADLDEVRSRFRDLAKKYHPDHFQSASPQFREAAESEFKRIREAYERVLTRHGARP